MCAAKSTKKIIIIKYETKRLRISKEAAVNRIDNRTLSAQDHSTS